MTFKLISSEQPRLARDSEWLGMLVTAAQVAQGSDCKGSLKAGEGRMKYVNSQTPPPPPPPPPSFYNSSRVAEGSFLPKFAKISKLSQACITRKSSLQYLNINNIRNKKKIIIIKIII